MTNVLLVTVVAELEKISFVELSYNNIAGPAPNDPGFLIGLI